MKKINYQKNITNFWFDQLQKQICFSFEGLERELFNNKVKFNKRYWTKKNKNEGGGKSYFFTGGKIFDKVGVNKSTVSGKFEKNFKKSIYGASKNSRYWASGVSVVAHMKNPKIPAIHFNTRYIVTTKDWFGGGIDATPSFKDKKEAYKFHQKLKKVCLTNNKNYLRYKNNCDKYFYLPHRNEARGIGGIFFDYETQGWEKNFKFVRELGLEFINICEEIISKKCKSNWT